MRPVESVARSERLELRVIGLTVSRARSAVPKRAASADEQRLAAREDERRVPRARLAQLDQIEIEAPRLRVVDLCRLPQHARVGGHVVDRIFSAGHEHSRTELGHARVGARLAEHAARRGVHGVGLPGADVERERADHRAAVGSSPPAASTRPRPGA